MYMKSQISQIIRNSFPLYKRNHRLPLYILKSINRIMICRTSEMGGHAKICSNPKCSHVEAWYNSCKTRGCPQCNDIQVKKWLDKQIKRLLQIDHFHMIFTIPHELNSLWLKNRKEITEFFFKCCKE